ncbi:class I SAM-dependent methyltransferase [Rhodovibrionaceae bacterium A322]
MLFENHRKTILSVRGSMSPAETELLYSLASQVTKGCILEVGSWRGRSSTAMGLATLDAGMDIKVYAVDPHEPFTGVYGGEFGAKDRGHFYQNMLRTGCYKAVRLINLSSEIIAPGWKDPISLLFIDGDHSYEGVKRDAECWLPHLVPGGTVVFDDAVDEEIGPFKLIEELLADGGYERTETVGKVVVLKKKA